jgi:hypothetical protein
MDLRPSPAALPSPSPPAEPEILADGAWQAMRRRHEERVSPWTSAQVDRTSRGEKHPVYDFLFDYYRFRPSQLLRWHPGLGRILQGEEAEDYLQYREYRRLPGGAGGVAVDPATWPAGRRESVLWIRSLLENSRDRPGFFGCFGLHEWAMVYRSEEVRHAKWPLRLSPAEIAKLVESGPVRCSHYDAFRFFTLPARPLNRLQPAKNLQPELEQKGCLHANMDLYKWAHKLSPFAPSELVADTFLLAIRIREMDMRASPYDLSGLGFAPIRIETPEGRSEYETMQRRFSAEAEPLRARLIEVCHRLASTWAS